MSEIILLVEDNPADAEMAIRAFQKSNLGHKVIHLQDGQEALDYLFNDQNQMPRLILLDVKMPRVDGITVLRRLKSDPQKKIIPIVMVTSSKEDRDIIESYELGVNAYIVKPVDFKKFSEAVSLLGLFWMTLNEPPRNPGTAS